MDGITFIAEPKYLAYCGTPIQIFKYGMVEIRKLFFCKFFIEYVKPLIVLPTDHFKIACIILRIEITDSLRNLEQN